MLRFEAKIMSGDGGVSPESPIPAESSSVATSSVKTGAPPPPVPNEAPAAPPVIPPAEQKSEPEDSTVDRAEEAIAQAEKELADKIEGTRGSGGKELTGGEKRAIARDFYLARLPGYSIWHEPGPIGEAARFLSPFTTGREYVGVAKKDASGKTVPLEKDGKRLKFRVNWMFQYPDKDMKLVDFLKSEFENKVRGGAKEAVPQEPAPEPAPTEPVIKPPAPAEAPKTIQTEVQISPEQQAEAERRLQEIEEDFEERNPDKKLAEIPVVIRYDLYRKFLTELVGKEESDKLEKAVYEQTLRDGFTNEKHLQSLRDEIKHQIALQIAAEAPTTPAQPAAPKKLESAAPAELTDAQKGQNLNDLYEKIQGHAGEGASKSGALGEILMSLGFSGSFSTDPQETPGASLKGFEKGEGDTKYCIVDKSLVREMAQLYDPSKPESDRKEILKGFISRLNEAKSKLEAAAPETEGEKRRKEDSFNWATEELGRKDKGEPNNTALKVTRLEEFLRDNGVSKEAYDKMTADDAWSEARGFVIKTLIGLARAPEQPVRGAAPAETLDAEVPIQKEAYRTVVEMAGKRNPEEVRTLISKVEAILDQEAVAGSNKLGETIQEIKEGAYGQESFVDGKIAYLPAKGEAYFVGDTHGDSIATERIIKTTQFLEKMSAGKKDSYLVFLGDYADRGTNDVRNLELVLALKEKYPGNVILMRGNHEEEDTSAAYGLLDSLQSRFPSEGTDIFKNYHKLFNKLPNILVTGNGIVAVHGGIPGKPIENLQGLKNNEKLFFDMLWSDPAGGIEEMRPSDRGAGVEFGQKSFDRFMDAVGGRVMLRGHQNSNGQLWFNNRLVTIFSTGEGSNESHYKGSLPQVMHMSLEKTVNEISLDSMVNIRPKDEIREQARLEIERIKKKGIDRDPAWGNAYRQFINAFLLDNGIPSEKMTLEQAANAAEKIITQENSVQTS